ncbi:MAG: hypothetical protein RLZZ624_425 [Cyanobacteriota bacterium]|jgi:hypothetical protein
MAHVPFSSLPAESAQGGSPPVVPAPEPVSSAAVEAVCSRCGGSGRLRINDDSFRTCLDCLGQGVLPRFSSPLAAQVTAPLAAPVAAPLPAQRPAQVAAALHEPQPSVEPCGQAPLAERTPPVVVRRT